jgi:hypothetical protein
MSWRVSGSIAFAAIALTGMAFIAPAALELPNNWFVLRRQWEYSHAINAGIMFVAFCATTAASLRGKATAQAATSPSHASGSPINRPGIDAPATADERMRQARSRT